MTKSIKIVLLVASSALLVGIGWFFWTFDLAPGSYPYVQIYVVNAGESKVIRAIHQLKSSHPDFEVPIVFIDSARPQIIVGGRGKGIRDYWYHVYFYCRDSNEILHTWTRPAKDSTKTTFALVSLIKGPPLRGNWKLINKELPKVKNENVIKFFENQILYHIKDLIAKDTTHVEL